LVDHIKILVSTMTGTAELVAEEIADTLSTNGKSAEIHLMDDLDSGILTPDASYIICTSTYGQGDVPDNGQAFIDNLTTVEPNLSGIRFGVFALGDITYNQTFCNAGTLFDTAFQRLGATRVGEIMRHDASSGELPEDQAAGWTEQWLEKLDNT